MRRCLLVHGNHVGARLGEGFHVAVGLGDHQVAVQRQVGGLAQRAHHGHPDGNVGDEVAVHHVHVQQAAASLLQTVNLLAQTGEVSSQDRGGHFRRVSATHQPLILARWRTAARTV